MDLSTSYLGVELKHPVVASASPLTRDIDGIRRLMDAGAAAVVMASVFEEQVAADSSVLEERLETLRQAAKQGGVPIIASLNGETDNHDNAGCEVDQFLRHAAEKHARHASRALLADDDGIGILFLGEINDRLCDVAATGLEHDGWSTNLMSAVPGQLQGFGRH